MIVTTTIAAALATSDPKHVVLDENSATVYTEGDIPETPSIRRIRDWQFRDRFTQTELDAINHLAFTELDPIGQRLLMAIYTASDGVDLDGQAVNDGLNYWIYMGILTIERKAEILV